METATEDKFTFSLWKDRVEQLGDLAKSIGKILHCVGGCSDGHGQIPGALVKRPLIRFKKLAEKDGALSGHEKFKFHENSKSAMKQFEKIVIEHKVLDIMFQ